MLCACYTERLKMTAATNKCSAISFIQQHNARFSMIASLSTAADNILSHQLTVAAAGKINLISASSLSLVLFFSPHHRVDHSISSSHFLHAPPAREVGSMIVLTSKLPLSHCPCSDHCSPAGPSQCPISVCPMLACLRLDRLPEHQCVSMCRS